MSKRGAQLQTEFRYLDPRYRGELRYEVLPDDRVKNGETRSAAFIGSHSKPGQRLEWIT